MAPTRWVGFSVWQAHNLGKVHQPQRMADASVVRAQAAGRGLCLMQARGKEDQDCYSNGAAVIRGRVAGAWLVLLGACASALLLCAYDLWEPRLRRS